MLFINIKGLPTFFFFHFFSSSALLIFISKFGAQFNEGTKTRCFHCASFEYHTSKRYSKHICCSLPPSPTNFHMKSIKLNGNKLKRKMFSPFVCIKTIQKTMHIFKKWLKLFLTCLSLQSNSVYTSFCTWKKSKKYFVDWFYFQNYYVQWFFFQYYVEKKTIFMAQLRDSHFCFYDWSH